MWIRAALDQDLHALEAAVPAGEVQRPAPDKSHAGRSAWGVNSKVGAGAAPLMAPRGGRVGSIVRALALGARVDRNAERAQPLRRAEVAVDDLRQHRAAQTNT